jgi:hypothetical protein
LTKPIRLDGVEKAVTTNLEVALKVLRSKGLLRIWVDAICINQEDREERTLQIKHMKLIYSKAERVVSWVGISESQQTQLEQAVFFNDLEEDPLIARPSGRLREDTIIVLKSFFKMPYWERAWVIQEITAASQLVVLWDKHQMDWDGLVQRIEIFQAKKGFPSESFASLQQLIHFRMNYHDALENITLLEALKWSQYAKTTELRDRIYALLGVAWDGPNLVPAPNYIQPVKEILADMTKKMIRTYKSLDLLSLKIIDGARLSSERISWIPDVMCLTPKYLTLHDQKFLSNIRKFKTIYIKEGPSYNVLRVRGVMVGQIVSISSIMACPGSAIVIEGTSGLVTEDFNSTILPNRLRSTQLIDSVWQSLLLFDDKAVSTMTKEFIQKHRLIFASMWTHEFRGRLQNLGLIHWLDSNQSLILNYARLSRLANNYLQSLSTRSVDWDVAHVFAMRLQDVLQSSMRLMSTNRGSMGMAHPNAKVGDRICYIRGCSVPMILRPHPRAEANNKYCVVGSAFVHRSKEVQEDFETYITSSTGEEGAKIFGPDRAAEPHGWSSHETEICLY